MTKFGADVFTIILVTVLLYNCENCNSQPEDGFGSNIFYNKIRGIQNNFPPHLSNKRSLLKSAPSLDQQHGVPLNRFRHKDSVEDWLKKFKSPTKGHFSAPQTLHSVLQRRLVRQAYPDYRPGLYPSLPTPSPSYHHQPYANHNYLQPNQTNYTPSYNPQWQPTSTYNYSKPGYPAYPPSNSYGSNNPGNPTGYNPNYAPYNPRPSAPGGPNPADNPIFGQGQGHRYPYTPPTNYSSYGPQNPPGYQPYPGSSNFNRPTPGYSPTQGNRNNTSTYNPSQRPPFYSQNTSINPHTPNYPSYSTTQRYPILYNNTTQKTPYNSQFLPYNNSQPSSFNNQTVQGYPYRSPQNGPYGPYKPGHNYPNSGFPGLRSPQLNSTGGFPTTQQTGPYNGYNPNSNNQYPQGNYFANSYNTNPRQVNPYGSNVTRPNPNPGAGYNNNNYAYNPNQGMYTQGNSPFPGNGFYPQPQYNGTSTYKIADHYTPNIPNQPPHNYNFGPNNSPYSSNGTQDPTRVPPERFSY